MKKLPLLLICLITSIDIYAQESLRNNLEEPTVVERVSKGKVNLKHVEMNLQLVSTLNAEFIGKELDEMNFKLNRFRTEIKGDITDWISYHYRQSFNKYANPYEVDNLATSLEKAQVNIQSSKKTKFIIGKQLVHHGGHEYYANSQLVREYSDFNNLLPSNQAGVSFSWQINPKHEVVWQIANNRCKSDDELYPTGFPEGSHKSKVPFMYLFNWNSWLCNNALMLRYGAALGQQTHEHLGYYLTFGNTVKQGPLLAYFDVMFTRQELDQQGMVSRLPQSPQTAQFTEYLSFIGDIDYRFHPQWNAYVKGTYETARVYKANGNFQEGMYRRAWNVQGSVEFTPFKEIDLFIFFLYTYRGVILEEAAKAMGAVEPDTHRISFGLVYTIPVF